jgi:hypothetical protein
MSIRPVRRLPKWTGADLFSAGFLPRFTGWFGTARLAPPCYPARHSGRAIVSLQWGHSEELPVQNQAPEIPILIVIYGRETAVVGI